ILKEGGGDKYNIPSEAASKSLPVDPPPPRSLKDPSGAPKQENAKEFLNEVIPTLNKDTSSFSDNLRIELEKSGFNPWDVDVGLKYYKMDKEKLDKKENKIAYIVKSLRMGWAQELVKGKENKEEETIKYKNDINDNVKLSIDTFNELKELDPDEMYYIVRLNEQSLTVNWRDKDKTSTPLDIKDKNFPNEVKQIKFRAANARIGI
ncbi:MAG TPA: hypothetical protein VMX17_10530, partial [Candidatus Glassbacteria bacterium]|nr:hypothetical protein [Candidatus Glassbacteria bacterium]